MTTADTFPMVAKTFQGLEGVLSDELTALGATHVEQGRRMVAFEGDKTVLYRANFHCRTALRILKPIHKFRSTDADDLYEQVKRFNWGDIMSENNTFAIDTTVFSDDFRHSRFVTYRVKDAIADYFIDAVGKRPSIRLNNPDFRLDVHISGNDVTISLDSSGDPLFKRGWRVAQTEAPINEVLAAGIILLSGWNGQCDLIDPMCGSGTFLVEAALIAANIPPGVYRREYAFMHWNDFDEQLFNNIYNDDSGEREFKHKIYGSDINLQAIEIARRNIKNAAVGKMIELEQKNFLDIDQAPEGGMLITNPPYGERIKVADIEALYAAIGEKLKKVFKGYTAWVIGYDKDIYDNIGLKPSIKYPLLNGELPCQLRQYVIFDGTYSDFRRQGNDVKNTHFRASEHVLRKPRNADDDDTHRPRNRRDHDRHDRDRERDDNRQSRFRSKKPYAERGRDEDGNLLPDSYWHDPKFAERVVKHREPKLGKDKERPIVRGRRNGWKRRELNERDLNQQRPEGEQPVNE